MVIAAKHAIAKTNIRRIAIVDFDVHHGNGTQEEVAPFSFFSFFYFSLFYFSLFSFNLFILLMFVLLLCFLVLFALPVL